MYPFDKIIKQINQTKHTKYKFGKNELIELFIMIMITIALYYIIKEVISRKYIESFISPKPIGTERVDGVIYINLEGRDDRKELITKEMELMKLPSEKINKVSGIYIPKNGHKGCVQAHILALQIAKMNKWNTTFILEDDAELTCSPEDFQKKIEEMFKYFESDDFKKEYTNWDVILLCPTYTKTEDTNNSNVKRLKHGSTSSGYLINNHYIDILLDLFKDCNEKMTYEKWGKDNGHEPNALDQRWLELQKRDNWFTYKDNLIKQRDVWSTINNRGNRT
jgi:GR25 family glycosyltransferase involved in LPS biosynthesis